jgi:hypothetical protein
MKNQNYNLFKFENFHYLKINPKLIDNLKLILPLYRNVGHMHGNQSLPISSNSSNQRVQNMPNNFRENKYSAPRPIQMNDNLSNRNYDVNVNQRSNQKVNRGTQNLRKTERDELVDIEDKLQEIRSAFGKMEQYTRQDHANRDLLRGKIF